MGRTTKRRISEWYSEECTIGGVNLDALAAELPPELEGHWIANVVRGFGKFRGIRRDEALRDMFDEAVAAAIKAAREAMQKGADVTAYVKRAVRSRLTDLQRREDYRDARLENDDRNGLARGARSDFRIALLLISPRAQLLWRAWRRARGVTSAFAAELGTTRYLAETKHLPVLVAEMREALAYVRFVRGGGGL